VICVTIWWWHMSKKFETGFRSSGMWCCLIGIMASDVYKDLRSLKMLRITHSVTQHRIQEDISPQQHNCDSLKSCKF
jgi:hypothetical protein